MKYAIRILIVFTFLVLKGQTQNDFIKLYGPYTGEWKEMVQDPQGNLMMTGQRFSSQNQREISLFKVNLQGDTLWSKNYGGSFHDYASDLITTKDGNYAIVGYSYPLPNSQITFLKIQPSGQLIWSKSIGGLAAEEGYALVQNSSGEYYLAGKKTNTGQQKDFYLVKTDANGDTLWTRSFGGVLDDLVYDLILCNDGAVLMVGYTNSFNPTNSELYMVKVSNSGNQIWSKHYGNTQTMMGATLLETSDGGFILAGQIKTGPISTNLLVMRTNSTGDTLWTRSIGEVDTEIEANDIVPTIDGGFAITGTLHHWQFIPPNINSYVRGDALLAKFDGGGNLQGMKGFTINSTASGITTANGNSILQLADGRFAISGSYFDGSTFQLLLIITSSYASVGLTEFQKADPLFYPNPVKDCITLLLGNESDPYTLKLFKMDGVAVGTYHHSGDDGPLMIGRASLPNGMYIMEIWQNEHLLYTKRIVFE